jgi:hypothetical protein
MVVPAAKQSTTTISITCVIGVTPVGMLLIAEYATGARTPRISIMDDPPAHGAPTAAELQSHMKMRTSCVTI